MLTIRHATRDDVPQLLGLIRQLAAYERKADRVVTTAADLLRHGFGPQPKFRALLAEWDGEAAGYASTFYFYSTYQGRPAIFIEDLFVRDTFRNRGIGKSLLSAIAKLAVNEGCFGLRWEVLDWNRPAIEWYGKLGATFLDERKAVAFDAEAMRKLAAASES
jgi:GNAT superfamily N-acetyltransferase